MYVLVSGQPTMRFDKMLSDEISSCFEKEYAKEDAPGAMRKSRHPRVATSAEKQVQKRIQKSNGYLKFLNPG